MAAKFYLMSFIFYYYCAAQPILEQHKKRTSKETLFMMHRILSLSAIVAGCTALAIPAAAQDHTFKVNMPGNEQSIAYQSVERFDEVLTDLTGGSVEIDLFANSALGDQESSLEA